MTLQTDLETAVAQVQADAAKLHDVVHGNANTTVQTEGGGVKTVAKTIQEIEDTATAAGTGYVNQAQQAAADADADRQAAESAASSAQQSAHDAAASAANAAAVVTGGTATLDPQPGMIPLADARGQIDPGWVEPETQQIDAYQLTGRTNCRHAFVYDTTLDGDGGEWRHKCAHTSWYQKDRPTGRYFGVTTSGDAVAAGAGVGDWYLSSSDWWYYKITQTTPSITTEKIYRAGHAEFPARVAILTWDDRIEIHDLTTPTPEMWMVFPNSGYSFPGGGIKRMCAASDGVLMAAADNGLWRIDWVTDQQGLISTGADQTANRAVGDASAVGITSWSLQKSRNLAGFSGNAVYSVAAKRLPGAPRDRFGRVVPTWAVGGLGGLTIFTHDGGVEYYYESSFTNRRDAKSVAWGDHYLFWTSVNAFADSNDLDTQYAVCALPIEHIGRGGTSALGSSGYYQNTPYRADPSGYDGVSAHGDTMVIARANDHAPAIFVRGHHAGPVVYGSRLDQVFDYSGLWGWSGLMVAGTRYCLLASAEAGQINGSEHIVNGGFDADTADWIKTGASAITGGKGIAETSSTASSDRGCLIQAITVEAGKWYKLEFTARGLGTGTGNATVSSTTNAGAGDIANFNLWGILSATAAEQKVERMWKSNVTGTVYVQLMTSLSTGHQYEFDDVFVRECESNRREYGFSYANMAAKIYGAITKSAIKANNDLCEYTGWSLTDYMEVSNPDYMQYAADFTVKAVIRVPAGAAGETLLGFGYYTAGAWSGAYWHLTLDASGLLTFTASDGTNTDTITHPDAIDDDIRRTVIVTRDGGTWRIHVRGRVIEAPVTVGDLSNAQARFRIGSSPDGTFFSGGLMLLSLGGQACPDYLAEWIEVEELEALQRDIPPHITSGSTRFSAVTVDPVTGRAHMVGNLGRAEMQDVYLLAAHDDTPIDQSGSYGHGACGGFVVEAGALGALAYVPRQSLRDASHADRNRQAGEPTWEFYDMDGASNEVRVPGIRRPETVTLDGAVKRQGPAHDYTMAFDGWGWRITFAVTPAAGSVCGVLVRE